MGYIYKITNKVNGKIYIGKTIKTIEERFKRHIYDSRRNNSYFYNAIKKYGIENFIIEEIENVDNSKLNEREKYWISFYNSNFSKIGYNGTIGGDGYVKVDEYILNEINKLWDSGFGITEISNMLDLNTATVKFYLKDSPNFSEEERKKRANIKNSEEHSKPVLMYDLNGNFICRYGSVRKASENTGFSVVTIFKCCRNIIPNIYIYQFRYEGEESPGKCINPTFYQKLVCQKTTDGEIVSVYKNAEEAAVSLNVDPSCIRRCCYKQKKTCRSYIWEFVNDDDYMEYYMKYINKDIVKSVS